MINDFVDNSIAIQSNQSLFYLVSLIDHFTNISYELVFKINVVCLIFGRIIIIFIVCYILSSNYLRNTIEIQIMMNLQYFDLHKQFHILMRFSANLSSLAIPEWKQCYIDYQTLKLFVIIIKQIVESIEFIDQQLKKKPKNKIKQNNTYASFRNADLESQNGDESNQNHITELLEVKHVLKMMANQVNKKFYQKMIFEIKLSSLFLQMKNKQLTDKFLHYESLGQEPILLSKNPQICPQYISLMEYLYIEIVYLKKMEEITIQTQRKILKKHKKNAAKIISTPQSQSKNIKRFGRTTKMLTDKLQDHYIKYSDMPSKKSRQHIRDIAQLSQHQHMDSFLFGLWVGIAATVLIFLIVMLIYNEKSIETDKQFNRDFPTWRGAAFWIYYIWIIGFNIWVYEKYFVNHRLIFKFNDHHHSTSTDVFKLSGFFTTLFLILFLIYALIISNIISSQMPAYFLVLIVLVFLAIYFFTPLPIFNWRGRLYGLKLILISIGAPLLGVTYPVIWFTDQTVSLVSPLKDLTYTICYYTQLDLTNIDAQNTCSDKSRPYVAFVVGAICYSLRIIQCLRQGYDSPKYIFTPPFFNTLKYSSSILTITLSFAYKAGSDSILYAWIVSASISTIYSYFWDLKMDWGLLDPNANYKFLRKHLTYPFYNYYILMVVNFIFRLAWILNFSPSIVSIFGSPQIFSLVTGCLQITRRGMWNLLRTQKQHLVNCQGFRAMPSTEQAEDLVIKKIQQQRQRDKTYKQIQQTVANQNKKVLIVLLERIQTLKRCGMYKYEDQFTRILSQKIQQKQRYKYEAQAYIAKTKQQLDNILKNASIRKK